MANLSPRKEVLFPCVALRCIPPHRRHNCHNCRYPEGPQFHTATNVGRLSVAGQSDPRAGDCEPRERSPELSTKVDICVNGVPSM